MIEISRALARRFRAVLRQSLAGPRGDAPLILCRAGPEGLTLEARRDDVAVRYQEDGPRASDSIAFRASVLAEFEGRSDEPATIEQVAFGKGRAHWTDGGVPRVLDIETGTPDSVPPFPETPKRFAAQPTELLYALDEAARTTAKESGRLALSRLQVRGRNGEVIATDGRQLLVQGGFTFPWQEDLLVPRLLAFGCRELGVHDQPVGVGRTESHVAVRVGPWLFLLAIDTHSRFPDVGAVIPKPNSTKSRLRLDHDDAAFLASILPKLPGRDGQHEPITLDLSQPPVVRARADGDGPATEVVLSRSSTSGPPVRLNTDRRLLFRATKLGFREIGVGSADQPLVCLERANVYVWMPLEKSNVIPPSADLVRISSAENPSTPPEPTAPKRRRTPMPTPTPKNPASDNGGTGPPDRGVGLAELIEEAEALRAALADASARTARLIAALKHERRRSRALETAVATLRQLRLGP